jgi:hypothetical protein
MQSRDSLALTGFVHTPCNQQDERAESRVHGAYMLAQLAAADAHPVTVASVCAAGLPGVLVRLLAAPPPPPVVRAAAVTCLRRLSLFAPCRVRLQQPLLSSPYFG